MNRLGIYIHWPFCRSKCPYCDFFSEVKKDVPQSELIKEYLQDLEYYRLLNDSYQVDSIFFGGGTPSLLEPKYIGEIIDTVTKLWNCTNELEISLEANPNTNQPNLFSDLKTAGINRLSLGVQALNEQDLKFLGRTHSLKEAELAIDQVLKSFENHSIDLIYARPNQTENLWLSELSQAASFGFKHLSLYQLTIEENTVFAKKGYKAAEEEIAQRLYQLTEEVLNQNGYYQYEISNYAKNGFECRHNLGYWQGDDYVGVGRGAVGYIHHQNQLFNTTHRCRLEQVFPEQRAEELIIMGLRLNKGINKQRFLQQCGIELLSFINLKNLDKLMAEKLVAEDDNHLYVTSKGRMLLNYVIERLCL